MWVDGDESKCVDYGEIPPNTDGSQDAAVYVVDEDLATSTGAAICPGIDAVVKKLRVGEISTAIIRKDYGFKEGPCSDRRSRGSPAPIAAIKTTDRVELVKIVPQTPNWEIKTTDLKIEAVPVATTRRKTPGQRRDGRCRRAGQRQALPGQRLGRAQ